LTADEVGLRAVGWTGETPLWYYILREAAVKASGNRLGPVGGRIVADVLVGLLDRDPASVRSADPAWQPGGSMIDLLLQSLSPRASKADNLTGNGVPTSIGALSA
jgi:hypothetical protein